MIIAAMLGMLAGIIMGMLPGIGATTMMLILLPLLSHTDIVFVFAFYFSMLATSQYFGSVTAIAYGYPGEISSIPAVIHGHGMMKDGQGANALIITGTGSFVASMIGMAWLLILYLNASALGMLFRTHYLVPMFLLIMLMMVMITPRKLLSSIMLMLGLLLGKIGYDSLHAQHILIPMHTMMDAGIPFFPLFAGMIIVPLLIEFIKNNRCAALFELPDQSMFHRLRNLISFQQWSSMLRGSMIGSVIGLVPGASYMISSNVAESAEKQWNPNSSRKELLVAAESANNAACITVLIPLLVFAIPIIPSEAVVLSIAEGMGFGITTSLTFVQENLPKLILMLFVINLVNWLLAGYFYKIFIRLYHQIKDWIYPALLITVMALMITVAWLDHQLLLSIMVFGLSVIAGLLLRDQPSKMVMIFGFFLSDSVLDEIYRFVIIYF